MADEDSSPPVVLHWFRKGLRLHDNPALKEAVAKAEELQAILRPIYVLDTNINTNTSTTEDESKNKLNRIGPNRLRFLVESLDDLDNSLRALETRLFIFRGPVKSVFKNIFKTWNVKLVTFEHDTEPQSKRRDALVAKLAEKYRIKMESSWSHTLYESSVLLGENNFEVPKTYRKFVDVMKKSGAPPNPVATIENIPNAIVDPLLDSSDYNLPTLAELKVSEEDLGPLNFPGGESVALERLEESFISESCMDVFEKQNLSATILEPYTTVLSPYLALGCLSCRLFYKSMKEFEKKYKRKLPAPLLGQLYGREFYYLVGADTPNFTQIQGNPICRQIKWDDNPEYLEAWRNGKTGYPFIDAIMSQLKTEGWIHQLARNSVACFLTRGDLWVSWEKGQEVFEEFLLDADVYHNAGNWMWLSASAFFHQYYRVYSPIKYGMKTDPTGEYIRKYIPQLAKFPKEFIYEPWTASLEIQKTAECIVGEDYPKRIVAHEKVLKVNLKKMATFFKNSKSSTSTAGGSSADVEAVDSPEPEDDGSSGPSVRKQRKKRVAAGTKKRKSKKLKTGKGSEK